MLGTDSSILERSGYNGAEFSAGDAPNLALCCNLERAGVRSGLLEPTFGSEDVAVNVPPPRLLRCAKYPDGLRTPLVRRVADVGAGAEGRSNAAFFVGDSLPTACFLAGLGRSLSSPTSLAGAARFLGDFGTVGPANAAVPRKTGSLDGEDAATDRAGSLPFDGDPKRESRLNVNGLGTEGVALLGDFGGGGAGICEGREGAENTEEAEDGTGRENTGAAAVVGALVG